MKQTDNKIAAQSKKWIIESLIELMNIKTFQEVTISELASHADLGRRTFYRNFTSKEDVIESHLNLMINEFITYLNTQEVLTSKICLLQIFTLCQKNKSFLLGLYHSNMLSYLLEKWNLHLPIIHQTMIDKLPNFPNQSDKTALEYTLAFNTGGVWNVVSKWVSSGMKESSKELTYIVMKLICFNMKKL